MSSWRGSGGVELERGGILIENAVALLRESPQPTARLAERVLALRGNPAVGARAVWTLLGDDPRFRVSASGEWSIRIERPAAPRLLCDEEWVVVDVETTGGGAAAGHRITEVAAVVVRGGRISDVYSTLVNPGRSIPRMITALTGISDAMVWRAPLFREIAGDLAEKLRGRVFVAHNAGFDWRFVCAELHRATGTELAGRKLCTVRLARRVLPHLPSRSLGALADYFGYEIVSRHRATDDALAAARVLLRLLDLLDERGIRDWHALDRLLSARPPRRRRRAMPRSADSA